jgi:hypothetical protein
MCNVEMEYDARFKTCRFQGHIHVRKIRILYFPLHHCLCNAFSPTIESISTVTVFFFMIQPIIFVFINEGQDSRENETFRTADIKLEA